MKLNLQWCFVGVEKKLHYIHLGLLETQEGVSYLALIWEIIPGLIRGRNVLEEQLRGQVEEARRLKKYLKIGWVFFCACCTVF
ncbi:hypothetical protein HanRHA438_Chr08g0337761 [Helianthus annuus]|uniref:Uncharacterized protein n=1 Tax=Helianthus annuus TaxID=4232 RepID=A0A251U347_HELAN|nr:hypothetical protein HanXRQr2_Chr08g0326611 [Helianthus annuus]KAJ0545716.1 hypothetical protein HanIR_Chr08g0352861 [Helianthus annuus]KAJ0552585.1 hypothetical protein HanHA89_Chr08g0286861 [Helianthus annuus]KAJ0718280.1 hypothetical protein HanLR1_Chr08g0268881 [Helianthus annuus]KAJ0721516.1 hypothetical protein HanOQP8_Chr08g0276411 [Helianthus annuus]